MPQTGSPILRLCAQIQCHFAKGFFAGTDGQKMMVQPRIAVPIKQASHKLPAVAADEEMTARRIFHQSADACAIKDNVDGFKATNGFLGEAAGMVVIADTDIAAKAHAFRCPGE